VGQTRTTARPRAGRADHRPGKIEPLDPPTPPAETEPRTGRETLQLLGCEARLNQPLDERDEAEPGRREQR
jgi:hypothetical protein